MTTEDLILGEQLQASIASTEALIESITTLLADADAMDTAVVLVTATGYTSISVGAEADAREMLEAKKTELETTLASLEAQFAAL